MSHKFKIAIVKNDFKKFNIDQLIFQNLPGNFALTKKYNKLKYFIQFRIVINKRATISRALKSAKYKISVVEHDF